MKKWTLLVSNVMLLCWFFLDMVGVYIGDKCLVTRSYKEDGVFFLIFLLCLSIFIFKEKIGKYILSGWLTCWFLTQFFSHWYYTIVGNAENKISYFSGTIKLFDSANRYIPDLYHIVLHLLIALSLTLTIFYCLTNRKGKRK